MKPFPPLRFVALGLCITLGVAPLLAGVPGEFEETGSMTTGRTSHTETLLPNGKVLAAGGSGAGGATASTELYDPASGTWSVTGNLAGSRYSHTATLLSNGNVLAAGGFIQPWNFLNPLAPTDRGTAELYNPSSGTWSDAGSFLGGHHTAILLPDGKVLVAGGDYHGSVYGNLNVYTNAARLYDPASGTWSGTGAMTSARARHTATLLPNGKVLVTGGLNGNATPAVHASAELYDPATGTWSPTGNLMHPRCNHTGTLLQSGKVLVAGGNNQGASGAAVTTAELYDPSTGTWTDTGSLIDARAGHTATLLASNRVLVTGGSDGSGALATAEIYDPATGRWSSTGNLRQPHRGHRATLLPDNRVLIAGGGTNDSRAAELYTESPTTPSLLNISTRLRVLTGDNAMIGGFIITGTAPKTVIVRGMGPSLVGVPGALQDPVIEVHGSSGELLGTNDNWRDAATRQQIINSGLAPTNDAESALWGVINPGAYTVVVRGKNDTTGIGLFEVYDLDQTADAALGNVSTRGLTQTGDDVMIGGIIVGGGTEGASTKVLVRAIGPSIPLNGALADPTLELRDASGTLVVFNDNWKTRADGTSQQAEIEATTLPPSNDLESAALQTLGPGQYTAIVRGRENTIGIGLVEVYNLR